MSSQFTRASKPIVVEKPKRLVKNLSFKGRPGAVALTTMLIDRGIGFTLIPYANHNYIVCLPPAVLADAQKCVREADIAESLKDKSPIVKQEKLV